MSFEFKGQKFLESDYGLGRGYASSLRLNFQHHLLRQLLGYSIPPDLVSGKGLPQTPKIADVGAGTAQWLIDVAHEFPSAELDGFDISGNQFPSSAWLPSNITLTELDITKSIPANLEGQYDLVHVQLFLCVVQKEDPSIILKELFKMLKPEGVLLWVEYDPTSFRVISPHPSLKQIANEQHLHIICGPEGRPIEWPSKLPQHIEDADFDQIVTNKHPLRPELYAPFMQCHLCAAEEVSFTAMSNDGPEAQGPAFRKLLGEVYEECKTGVTMAEDIMVVTARKPPRNQEAMLVA
ncbi:MAG: hypothetical protein Q9218_006434 [Villophora microphyllina]